MLHWFQQFFLQSFSSVQNDLYSVLSCEDQSVSGVKSMGIIGIIKSQDYNKVIKNVSMNNSIYKLKSLNPYILENQSLWERLNSFLQIEAPSKTIVRYFQQPYVKRPWMISKKESNFRHTNYPRSLGSFKLKTIRGFLQQCGLMLIQHKPLCLSRSNFFNHCPV